MRLSALAIVLLAAMAAQVRAEPRDVLRDCQALLDRANRASPDTTKPSEADIARCRQVVRDWTLRDSRMLVDEQGRPLR